MQLFLSLLMVVLLFSSICLGPHSAAVAQRTDEVTRKLWDTAFIDSSTARKTQGRRRPNARQYRIATPNVPVDNVAPDTVVGVTLWRLRPAMRSDSGERLIVHDSAATKEWLPERISATTKLAPGDRLRISVESARAGYLYVIDREQYADGSLGDPYLIFPTTRTLNGDNHVNIGKLAEIPSQDDSPPYFTVRKSRPDHVAEVVSVLVSPAPLEEVQITDRAQKLPEAQVATWEKAWSTSIGWLEMAQGTGRAWTREEREASLANTRTLTANGPAPQILFYRPSAKPTEPMFVKLHLWYKSSTRRTNH